MSGSIFWNEKNTGANGVKLLDIQNGQIELSQEGGKLLTDLDSRKNCNLCFIFGNARSGKSFMMNCLSGVKGLFNVINDSEPCTRGVDISTRFIPHTDLADYVQTYDEVDFDKAEDMLCGFVDVEGQGAEGTNHDTMLALPLLLTGKVVLFNHKGAPTVSHMLSQMGVLAKAAEFIDLADESMNENSESPGSEEPKKFGHLHVLFRDFSFEGDEQTIYDQLFKNERVPKKQATNPGGLDPVKATKERNSVRKLLLDNFTSINVWLLKQPANADLLMAEDELSADNVDPEFLGTVQKLLHMVSHQLSTPTKFNGANLSGPKLHELLSQVCMTINEGEAINVPSVFRAMEKNSVARMHKQCLEEFNHEAKTISSSFPVSAEQLEKTLQELEEKILNKFITELASCTLDAEKEEAQKDIKTHIEKTRDNFNQDNKSKILDIVTKAYQDETSNLKVEFEKFFSSGLPFENKQKLDSEFSSLNTKMEEKIKKIMEHFPEFLGKPESKLIRHNSLESLNKYFDLKVIENGNALTGKKIQMLKQVKAQEQKEMAEQTELLKTYLSEAKGKTEQMKSEVTQLREENEKTKKRADATEEKIRKQKQELEELKKKQGCTIS